MNHGPPLELEGLPISPAAAMQMYAAAQEARLIAAAVRVQRTHRNHARRQKRNAKRRERNAAARAETEAFELAEGAAWPSRPNVGAACSSGDSGPAGDDLTRPAGVDDGGDDDDDADGDGDDDDGGVAGDNARLDDALAAVAGATPPGPAASSPHVMPIARRSPGDVAPPGAGADAPLEEDSYVVWSLIEEVRARLRAEPYEVQCAPGVRTTAQECLDDMWAVMGAAVRDRLDAFVVATTRAGATTPLSHARWHAPMLLHLALTKATLVALEGAAPSLPTRLVELLRQLDAAATRL